MIPAEDREVSPRTGWTRRHWEAVADDMLTAAARHRSPLGARYDLPGPASRNGVVSDGLEGFARTFLLAGFRTAGAGGADPTGLLERYAEGLAAGTDPSSPERWPRPDELGQAKVEAASVALVLQLTRPWLWDRLDEGVRQRTVEWLGTVVGQPYPPINWVWFRVVVESFLREVGGPWSQEDVEADLAVHASLRRPGGWLSDHAEERAYDHYTGWALHLYPLLWTEWFDVVGSLCPPALRETWAGDLRRYLRDAVALVGADGSPLLQGRSLVYRFAAAAPFWVGALAGVGGVAPGQARRAASGVLRHFLDRGALDGNGLLSLGWHHGWPGMRQSYSGPASPYWAAKGMLGLALPADHPVWTEPELPLPVETADVSSVVTAPGWLVTARRRDGIVTVVNHGTDHAALGAETADSPLYARLGYSTATVPPLTGPTVADPVDNSVVLLDADDRATHRTGFGTLHAEHRPGDVLVAASSGRVRWVDSTGDASPDHGSGRSGPVTPGPVVTVASVVRDGVEVRVVRVAPPAPGQRWRVVRLGGWPVAGEVRPSEGPGARVATARLSSELRPLAGLPHAGVLVEHGTSPLGDWTGVPWLAARGESPHGVFAALVVLAGAGDEPGAPSHTPAVEVGPESVTVRWGDGVRTEVAMPVSSLRPG
ncbi:DUF2264 domain-containing protein [Actinoalloteichus spitiensis]|uniref:DUF2264 domain-containing protein n=1 Tax=Actinoalloteichus spitiensis TaxID=252394 RepID=UPI00037D893D|nr:DUF2264 domain-containing protein [Actinoalloteichus spitiensis]